MRQWVWMALVWIGLAGAAMGASDLQIHVSAHPDLVNVGDPLELRIVVSGPDLQGIPPLQLPELNYFKQGQSTEETSYKPAGGALQITRTRIVHLTAARSGTAKLKPIVLSYKGKTYHSNPVKIEIKGAEKPGVDQATDLFVRSELSATKVRVGEPIEYRLKVYRQFAFKEKPTLRLPVFQGFFQTMETADSAITKENRNGKVYYVAEVVRRTLYATEPGKVTVSDAAVLYRLSPGSPMITAEAPPVTVIVMPLPEPKPKGFSGAVGDFKLTVESKGAGTQYAPISLKIQVTGVGNLESVTDVIVPQTKGVKWVRGAVKNQLVHNEVTGRVIEYSVIPQQAGTIILEPVKLVVYSPSESQYLTLSSGRISLKVKPGDSATTVLDKSIQLPIAPLRPFLNRSTSSRRGFGPWFWILLAVNGGLVAAGVGIRLRRRYVEAHRADFDWAIATDRTLKILDQLSRDPMATGVASLVYRAVHACLSAKLRQPVEGMDAIRLESALRDVNATHTVVDAVLRWRSVGESLAFSPNSHDVTTIRELIQQSIQVVESTRWLGRSD